MEASQARRYITPVIRSALDTGVFLQPVPVFGVFADASAEIVSSNYELKFTSVH
jgi:hypothetical protein